MSTLSHLRRRGRVVVMFRWSCHYFSPGCQDYRQREKRNISNLPSTYGHWALTIQADYPVILKNSCQMLPGWPTLHVYLMVLESELSMDTTVILSSFYVATILLIIQTRMSRAHQRNFKVDFFPNNSVHIKPSSIILHSDWIVNRCLFRLESVCLQWLGENSLMLIKLILDKLDNVVEVLSSWQQQTKRQDLNSIFCFSCFRLYFLPLVITGNDSIEFGWEFYLRCSRVCQSLSSTP